MKKTDSAPPERTRGCAALLAAAAAVIHRRTGDERVPVRCRVTGRDGARRCVLYASVSGDTAFGDLASWAASEVDALRRGDGARDRTDGDGPERAPEGEGEAGPEQEQEQQQPGCVDPAPELVLPLGGAPSACGFPPGSGEWARQLQAALEAGTRVPGTRVAVLDLMAEGAAGTVTAAEGTGVAAEKARRVHECVAAQAALRPGAVAVSWAGQELSYAVLDERAERVAGVLRARGVRPDSVVAVLHRRSADLIVALLGVLKADAAYLALDPEDPPDRYAELLALAGAGCVLVESALRDRLPGGPVVLEVAACQAAREEVGHARARRAAGSPGAGSAGSPDMLAYVSFTSGTTGRPKGVAVTHRGVSRLLRGPDWIDIGPDDVFLEVAPVAFDASTVEIWGALMNGARLVVVPGPPTRIDRLRSFVERTGVTVLLLATGLFQHLMAQDPGIFGTVRHVLTGGDTVSPVHVRQLLTRYPRLVFTNGYGPTENTSFTACWTTRGSVPDDGRSVPVGTPVNGTRVLLLDPAMRRVPPGVVGELYAGGEGLARGYAGQPAATAERFVADPFAAEPGGRLYRTGDLARWLPDGTLEFVGRADRQVKVRGFRVEPAHVEARLADCPEVAQAAVVPQRDRSGENRLLAYVVPRSGAVAGAVGGASPGSDTGSDTGAGTAAATGEGAPAGLGALLRERLSRTLPEHMVPWAVLVRPEGLPLDPNGKLNRGALPHLRRSPRSLAGPPVLPRSPLEQRLADIWSAVLEVEPVGVEDDFFELGGHSLLAARILSAMEHELSVTVPARALYLRPTIALLAQSLTGSGPRTAHESPMPGV